MGKHATVTQKVAFLVYSEYVSIAEAARKTVFRRRQQRTSTLVRRPSALRETSMETPHYRTKSKLHESQVVELSQSSLPILVPSLVPMPQKSKLMFAATSDNSGPVVDLANKTIKYIGY
jgi:hypothetical protein